MVSRSESPGRSIGAQLAAVLPEFQKAVGCGSGVPIEGRSFRTLIAAKTAPDGQTGVNPLRRRGLPNMGCLP